MAAATPVLERRNNSSEYSDDMQHNARIRDNYARLIDPNTKLNDLVGGEEDTKEQTSAAQSYNQSEFYRANPREALYGKQAQPQAAAATAESKPDLVTNARADSYIFRADSPINRRYAQDAAWQETNYAEEEENEDLKPTRTTIQYGNAERADDEVMPTSTVQDEEHLPIGKREKIVIGAFISMVVALFVLVIINSAIISGINSDISDAQSALENAQNEYAQIYADIEEAKSAESVYAFAAQNNMVMEQSED